MLYTLIVELIAKSEDKFVIHNMKCSNTDHSTRFCRRVSALYHFICKHRKNVLGCVSPGRPFSIMLVNLAFNATRNSHIKPKKC